MATLGLSCESVTIFIMYVCLILIAKTNNYEIICAGAETRFKLHHLIKKITKAEPWVI